MQYRQVRLTSSTVTEYCQHIDRHPNYYPHAAEITQNLVEYQ